MYLLTVLIFLLRIRIHSGLVLFLPLRYTDSIEDNEVIHP